MSKIKRLLSAKPSEICQYEAAELKQAIIASEGRTILAETIVTAEPCSEGVTGAEIARAFGADLLLLNMLDLEKPLIKGLLETGRSRYDSLKTANAKAEKQAADANLDLASQIKRLKELVSCPLGVNLEAINPYLDTGLTVNYLSPGRLASAQNFQRLNAANFDFLCLTGNPNSQVDHASLLASVKAARAIFKGLIFVGKMHTSGVSEALINCEIANAYLLAGADGILLPAVGTALGLDVLELKAVASLIRQKGALVISTIGTSQESASLNVIENFALLNKQVGTDIHHIGDGGYGGIAPVENILQLSRSVRGMKHTITRMANRSR